jgi:uncharacterized Zn ribbon protein
MRKNLFALIALAFSVSNVCASVEINETNFPDVNLRNLAIAYDANVDRVLSDEELAQITEIKVEGIVNLKGIEYFKNLVSFCLYYDSADEPSVTSLDLSKLYRLRSFSLQDCSGLTSLNLNPNYNLVNFELLRCPNVSSLKLPSYIRSIRLDGVDSLMTLNLKNHSSLKDIDISNSTINTFTMTKLPLVHSLTLQNNNITSITIEECKGLTDITCKDNVLGTLCLKNDAILQTINTDNNQLKVLIAEKCPQLGQVKVYNNQLMWLDMKDVKIVEDKEEKTLQLDNQQPSVEAVKISPTAVGLLIHDGFDVSRVKNLRVKGVAMTPKEINLDGIRYLALSDNGSDVTSLVGSDCYYEYDTKWPYASVVLPVTLHVDNWTKHQAYLKASKSEVKGKFGEADPAAPSIIRSQGYDGKLTFWSSNEDVVEVDPDTGVLTVTGGGKATIYVEGEETEYRLAPSTSYTVVVDKSKPIISFPEKEVNGKYGEKAPKNKLQVKWYLGTIEYTSSNEDKATVSADGEVTILGAGKVTISAIAPETDDFKAGKAEYTLHIAKATPKFSYEKLKISVMMGQPLPKNKLDVGLYDGVPKYESSNEEILYIDKFGQFHLLRGGIVKVTAYGDKTENCNPPIPAFYYLEIEDPDGISPIDSNDPSYVESETVYDLNGRKMNKGSINNGELKKGIYIIDGKKVIIK